MRIYTRTGDDGETGLIGRARVPKDDLRVSAYGEVDELNAALGSLRRCTADLREVDEFLGSMQEVLFEAGSELARSPEVAVEGGSRVRSGDVTAIERMIDRLDADLPPLGSFILPGGGEAAVRAHLARTVCRRAERAVVRLLREQPAESHVLPLLNRLSDCLFVIARWLNRREGSSDIVWSPRP